MVSQIERDARLDDRIVFYPCDAQKAFLEHRLIVVDGHQWDCDWNVLRSGLIKQHRGFKQKFHRGAIAPEVQRERTKLGIQADALFAKVFPDFVAVDHHSSWRPMITGPEPMHFDTYGGDVPNVVSFMNVSTRPRVYKVGESFEQLVQRDRKGMLEVHAETFNIDDFSYRLRCRTVKNQPPLDDSTPRHTVKFAPGSIWFFNAKTVSHEVVYGEGASGYGWPVPDCGAATQRSLLGV